MEDFKMLEAGEELFKLAAKSRIKDLIDAKDSAEVVGQY